MKAESVPDTDDPQRRLEKVLATYFEHGEDVRLSDRQRLIDEHPDLAAELAEFFNVQGKLHEAATALKMTSIKTFGPDVGLGGAGGLAPGSMVGDYEIVATIARGGMGIVYRARQRSLNRLVALKMLRDGIGATNDDLRRFQREAEAIANLDHPHIVSVFEIGEHEGHRFFSMKLVEGASLSDLAENYSEDQRGAARVIAAVARAIHHVHERGVLHRDLKPSNILIDERGQPLVVDFGLALQGDAQSVLTRTGLLPGTPSYMAPEQVDGRRGAVSPATDVHGLGTVLYALLTGRPPFKGVTPWATLARVRDEMPERPRAIRRAVDRDLETICLKCLEKEPARRYASALALADDLDRWLTGWPIAARRVGVIGRAWRLGRRHPWVAGLAAAVVVLAVSNAISLFHDSRPRVVIPVGTDTQKTALNQTVKQAATTTVLASSLNPSTLGQAVTFTATIAVTAPGSGIPTGSVMFYDGSTVIAVVAIEDETASFTTSSLSIGTHSIKADYSGDPNFKTSTSATLKQVVQVGSGTSLVVSTGPAFVAIGVIPADPKTKSNVHDMALEQITSTD